jgi:hypothetical protein
LIWQYQQNRAMGISSEHGLVLLPQIDRPRLEQSAPAPALPAPEITTTSEPRPNPYVNGYALTQRGIRVLAEEAYKLKDALPSVTVMRQNNEQTAATLASQMVTAFSRGGISSSVGFGQLGGPSETGLIILFDDPEHLPEPADKLKQALEYIGLKVTVIQRKVGTFQFFVGPEPE